MQLKTGTSLEVQPYLKIASVLSKRIRNGTYPPDTPLPSRAELGEEFGVARATVDRAIRHLSNEGIVMSRHGSGTFVVSAEAGKYRIACIGSGLRVKPLMPVEFNLKFHSPDEFRNRSEWRKLYAYDGVLLLYPEDELMKLAEAISGKIPTVLVNRVSDVTPFVSTDFRGTYRSITAERIAAHPEAAVYFLRSPVKSLSLKYRLEGFLEACRGENRFYEILETTLDFGKNLELFHHRIDPGKHVILISDALRNTGAVMQWGTGQNLSWGNQVFYSDFDNDYPPDVWGVSVTSFLQDMDGLARKGGEMLLTMLQTSQPHKSILLPPLRKDGMT